MLEKSEPSVRYKTLTNLMDVAVGDPIVGETRLSIQSSAPVVAILSKMHPDGYWLQTNPRTGETVGDGALYGSFATTHFCLSYLAELGLTRSHPAVAKAAERYLGLQQPDGDWYRHFSCLNGYNIQTFVRLGYGDDLRLKRSLELMLNTDRPDGGTLCDMHTERSKKSKSCIRGSVKALIGFSEIPEVYNHTRVIRLTEYFLGRGGIYRQSDPEAFVNRDMTMLSFPITWGANSWEILFALSRMGYGNDPRLNRAWEYLRSRRLPNGRMSLDWTAPQSPFKVGKRGMENKWITYYTLYAEKLRG